LALVKNDDYQRANVPLLPVVAGAMETRRQIVIYTLLLAPLPVIPSFIGMASSVYGGFAALAGGVMVWLSLVLYRTGGNRDAMRLFGYSILYLFLLFLALVVDHAVARYLVGGA
jgi:protoheme IX farnesyltransferase